MTHLRETQMSDKDSAGIFFYLKLTGRQTVDDVFYITRVFVGGRRIWVLRSHLTINAVS